jgi:hypothetical protein
MMMQYIWRCTCGHKAECAVEDTRLGAVYQCASCETVWGCVKPRAGGKAWVAISPRDVRFHRLLQEPEPETETVAVSDDGGVVKHIPRSTWNAARARFLAGPRDE